MVKRQKRNIPEPQLATMIDVFSMLIIFLIAGTVLGSSSIVLPQGLLLPKSVSKEALVVSPQLTIVGDQVRLDFSEKPFPIKAFYGGSSANRDVSRFVSEIKAYEAKNKGKENSGLMNLVADHGTTYDKVFNVIRIAREAGVRAILFISTAQHFK